MKHPLRVEEGHTLGRRTVDRRMTPFYYYFIVAEAELGMIFRLLQTRGMVGGR